MKTNYFIAFGLIGVHLETIAGETQERYEAATWPPLITTITAYRLPAMPYGHESTHGSTHAAEPWNLSYVTTAVANVSSASSF